MSSIQDTIINNNKDTETNFLEGIAYKRNSCVSIKAKFINENKKNEILNSSGQLGVGFFGGEIKEKIHFCNKVGHKWFYNQVRDIIRIENKRNRIKDSRGVEGAFILPLKDYLFRHDQGSFWMASYRIPQVFKCDDDDHDDDYDDDSKMMRIVLMYFPP
jgi:hypothetical protein